MIFLQKLRDSVDLKPFWNKNLLTLKISEISWRRKIEQNNHLISENESQLIDLEVKLKFK